MKQKNVIIVAPFDSTWVEPVSNGFKQTGFAVKMFDYRTLFGNIHFNPLFTFLNLSIHISKKRIINNLLIKACQKFKPDYLFLIKAETITPTTIDTIKSLGIKTLLWQIDPTFDPIIWPHTNTVGRKVDLYITCEPGSVLTKLEKRGFKKLAYMLGASDGTTMRFLQNQPKKYDIVLIGTYHPFREKYLKVLKGKDVHIWGWGNWQDSSVKEMFEGKALSQKEMLKVYSQAKIVIDIRRSKSSTIPTNLRPFEAAQVGAFILLEYAYNLKDVFKLNKEVDYFKSPSDLRQKVNYYLAHPQKRKQIAQAMFNRIEKDHTYKQRILNLFSTVKKLNL